MSDEVENDDTKNDDETVAKRTAQDAYADFIGKQAKSGAGSPFDTRGVKPVTKDEVALSTGKLSPKKED